MANLLPVEIILDILSRLPAEKVLPCTKVAKQWQDLVRHPYFADMQLRLGGQGLGILFAIQFSDKDERNVGLYYGEYNENNIAKQFSYKTLTMLNHPPINERKTKYSMVGSCNGLVCFSIPRMYRVDDLGVYIYNPITREYKRLIERFFHDELRPMVYGFGYVPSSNAYKIVRISKCHRVEVYTLGSGNGWRNKGNVPYQLRKSEYTQPSPGIHINGALHWLDYKEPMKILAFDLANEEFIVIPSPPCFLPAGYDMSKHRFQLAELGGFLCVVHQERGQCLDIWSLKKQEYQFWAWCREFRTCKRLTLDECKPFALTKSGEVLMWENNMSLIRYDPKTDTVRNIVGNDGSLQYFEAIPHMNSFVSLKALGEGCRERKRYMRK